MERAQVAAGHSALLDSEQMCKKWTRLAQGKALQMFTIPSWDFTSSPMNFLFSDKNSAKEENMSESTSLIKEPWVLMIFHETSDSKLTFENEMSLGSLKHFFNFIQIGWVKKEHLRTEIYEEEILLWNKFPLKRKLRK